ncbi:MAG: 30S ribosomal protein S12 methylthiotransferase RimO [Gemmatimonadota bacterium]|nr:MAG: 30S ribosomal protein S12 methylthiotransferase RimO [Gemmatimonadota bacterium]
MNKKAKIGLVSLGCAKNLVDSEILLGTLRKRGYPILQSAYDADVIIINTCTFIKEATEESIDAIVEAIELKKDRSVQALIVAGCLPQRYMREDMASELVGVDAFLGAGHYHRIAEVVERVLAGRQTHPLRSRPGFLPDKMTPREILTPHHYTYVKISEGCNNRCSYCVIPQVRGPHRSRRMKSIVEEVIRLLDERPLKEINVIGQDTTFYGTDLYGQSRLAHVLKKLARLKRVKWIRLLYTHPAHFDQDVIDVIRDEPALCKYVDLPLQHIDDAILKRMGRRVTRKEIEKLVERLRGQIPDLTLRTSFIVGFPGETEKQFNELLDFVENVQFERLGAFAYSREQGTPAHSFSHQVSKKVKRERLNRLMTLQRHISKRKNEASIGREFEVLVDSSVAAEPDLFLARTEGDAPEVDQLVYVTSKNVQPGDFLRVRITDAYEYDLVGEPL